MFDEISNSQLIGLGMFLLFLCVVYFMFLFRSAIGQAIAKHGIKGIFKVSKNMHAGFEAKPSAQDPEIKTQTPDKKYPEKVETVIDRIEAESTALEVIEYILSSNNDSSTKLFELYLGFKYRGEQVFLDKIKEAYSSAENIESKVEAAEYLARSYCHLKYYDEAIKLWQNLLEDRSSLDEDSIVTCLIGFSEAVQSDELSLKNLSEAYSLSTKSSNKAKVLWALNSQFKNRDDMLALSALVLQKDLQTDKKLDEDYLFDLGLASEAMEFDILAVHNYNRLLKLNKSNSGAQNNIAISLGRLGFKGLESKFYRKASESGDALAASNLAYNLIGAGMYKEAKQVLDICEGITGPDSRIQSRRRFIEKQEVAENEKYDDLLDESLEYTEQVLMQYGEARLRFVSVNELIGNWEMRANPSSKPIDVEIKMNGEDVLAEWSEKALLGTFLGKPLKEPKHFIGQIQGATLKIQWNDGSYNKDKRPSLVKSLGAKEYKHFGYILDGNLTVFKIKNGKAVEVAIFTRKIAPDKDSTSS